VGATYVLIQHRCVDARTVRTQILASGDSLELGSPAPAQPSSWYAIDCLDLSIIHHGPAASWTSRLNDAQYRTRFTGLGLDSIEKA
jgi:hypothetical protein